MAIDTRALAWSEALKLLAAPILRDRRITSHVTARESGNYDTPKV